MSHNRTSQYSAPYRRNNLLGLHQYAASEHFPSLGNWDRAKMEDLYVVRGTVGRHQPVHIMVVGVISSDKAYLQPHGNYDPTFMKTVGSVGRKAKLQFVISPPADDPDFLADYNIALKRLKAIQEEVARSPSRREHFIEGDNMKMNFLLFTEKEEPGEWNLTDEESGSEAEPVESDTSADGGKKPVSPEKQTYEVTSPYRHTWETVSELYHNNIMEVYGTNEELVDYRQFSKFLCSGTTVVISFVLKHYSIREQGSTQVVSDTYTASVISVSILREAEKIVRQSPSSIPKRRPLPISQAPSRKTLKFAADTFAPVRVRTESSSKSDRVRRPPTPFSPTPSSSTQPAAQATSSEDVPPSTSSSAISSGDSPLILSREVIELMVPFILDRMKNGPRILSTPVTPNRLRSPSLTLSTVSSTSQCDTESIVADVRTSNPSNENAITCIDPAVLLTDEGHTDSQDYIWVNVTADSDEVEDGVQTPVPGSSSIGPILPPSDDATHEEFEFVNETVEAEPATTQEHAESGRAKTTKSKSSSASQDKREGKRRRM